MIPIGGSDTFTDKRVDRMLKQNGYWADPIFYSPISIAFIFLGLIFIMAFTTLIGLGVMSWMIAFPIYPVACLSFFYLIHARTNNSFAFSHQELIVVNSNPPFRRIKAFRYAEIEKAHIRRNFLLTPLLLLMVNYWYVEIQSGGKTHRFHCSALDLDCFDENQTELTLDDLYKELRRRNISTEFDG
ncbi:MAG: hypothetical protein AAF206_15400 [Bacteroidota bacterium]